MKLNRGGALRIGAAALASTLLLGGGAVVYGQTATPGTPPPGTPGGRFGAGGPFGMFGRGAANGDVNGDATCPMTGAPVGAMMGGYGFGDGAVPDAVLKQLGMTADQVLAGRKAGQSLAQIAQAKGVDKAKLVATILAEHKTFLDGQVKAGTLTQAQADAMQGMMQSRVEWMVDQTTTGPGAGGRMMGRGGIMGGGFGPGMMGRGFGARG